METSEEDSFLAVVRHIADLLNEGQVRMRLLGKVACLEATFTIARALPLLALAESGNGRRLGCSCGYLSRA